MCGDYRTRDRGFAPATRHVHRVLLIISQNKLSYESIYVNCTVSNFKLSYGNALPFLRASLV